MEYTIFHLVLNWFQIMLSMRVLENELGIKTGDVLLADYKDYN